MGGSGENEELDINENIILCNSGSLQGKGAWSIEMDLAFKACFLGAWFTRHTISKGRAVEAETSFDVSKLYRYHHSLHPGEVHLNHNHPLSDWLEKLRDHTGCHSLSPPPLIPSLCYGGTIFHALSCALVGSEMYWHALAVETVRRVSEETTWVQLLPEGAEELNRILTSVQLDGGALPGSEVDYHPLMLYVAACILRRVVVLVDPWTPRGSAHKWPPTAGVFEPREQRHHDKIEISVDRLPPLCLAWETADR